MPYLTKWEESVNAREGYRKSQKNRMLLSAETLLGIRMTSTLLYGACYRDNMCLESTSTLTALSFLEIVPYLFSLPGVKSFLSQRLCQDPLESFFGCQRQRGGTSDNPNVLDFCRNTQALRVVNSFCRPPKRGNCRKGAYEEENVPNNVPLPKRRAARKK